MLLELVILFRSSRSLKERLRWGKLKLVVERMSRLATKGLADYQEVYKLVYTSLLLGIKRVNESVAGML